MVEVGGNLERIGCPGCGQEIDQDWWADLVDEAQAEHDGFTDLDVNVPCCDVRVSLNDLDHHWPTGFARFEVAAWNPDRDWPNPQELFDLAATLGHPVRQIMAHI